METESGDAGARTEEAGFLAVDGTWLECLRIPARTDAAPTLVFLHEGLGSVSAWRGFPARLAAAAGYGALVFSRAGYGRSDGRPGPWPVEFMHREAVEALPAVLREAGVRDAVLFGHSDGASIALLAAGSGAVPGVRALVLEAPHVFVEDVTVASIARLADALRATPELAARFARHHGENTEALLAAWTEVWLRPAFRRWDITASLPGVTVPTLVVQGEDDEYGTLAQVEAVRRGVRGPVETRVLPACGHSPHRDRPEEVVGAVVEFLGRVPSPKC